MFGGAFAENTPIRTLYISPIKTNMNEQIREYFGRFGKVNSVEIQQEDSALRPIGFVEFETAETAASVLSSTRNHHIGDGCVIRTKPAEPWQQPDQILNALDDDCLHTIFSRLSHADLASIANVCVRFHQVAVSVFRSKSAKLDLTRHSCAKARKILEVFGPLTKSIRLDQSVATHSFLPEWKIFAVIADHCTTALKELAIDEFRFVRQLPSDTKHDLAFALSKLEKLSLKDCDLRNGLNDILSVCVNLKVLHLEGCAFFADSPVLPKLPKLKELRTFFIKDLTADSRFIPNMIALNLTVKKLAIRTRPAYPQHFPIDHVRHITGFTDLDRVIDAISAMHELKALKLCDVDQLYDHDLITLAMGAGSQLERLHLEGTTTKNLTTIGLKKMLPLTTKLSLLTLKPTTMKIDANDYQAMLNTIRERAENRRLSVEMTSAGRQVRVPESIQMTNRDIFHIEEKTAPTFQF